MSNGNNMSIGRLILTLFMLLIVVVGGTFAWLTYSSKEAALVLTIGDINNTQIELSPYQVSGTIAPSTTYTAGVESQVVVSKGSNNSTSFALYYRINDLDMELVKAGLSYTVVDAGSGSQVASGKFSDLIDTSSTNMPSQVLIFDANALGYEDVSTTYKVYLWLDGTTSNQVDVSGSSLDVELNASIASVAISGNNEYGQTLRTTIDDAIVDNANYTYTYQWYYNDTKSTKGGATITGATNSTYTIERGLTNKYIYVEATLTNGQAKGKTLSDVTDSVISPRSATVTATSSTKTYDCTELKNSGCTAVNLLKSNHTVTCGMTTDSTITNAGSQTNTINTVVIKDENGNVVTSDYTITKKTGVLKVNQATVTMSLSPTTGTVEAMQSKTFVATAKSGNCSPSGAGTITATSNGTTYIKVSGTSPQSLKPTTSGVTSTITYTGTNKEGSATITVTYNHANTTDTNNFKVVSATYKATNDDTIAPANLSITSTTNPKSTTQTVTLKCTDAAGVKYYYFGTNASPAAADFKTITSTASMSATITTSMTATETVSVTDSSATNDESKLDTPTYYLYCKDEAGNVSNSSTITFVEHLVQTRLLTTNGTKGAYNSTNYPLTGTSATASSYIYILPNNTSVAVSGIMDTTLTGSNTSSYAGSIYTSTASIPSSGTADTADPLTIITTTSTTTTSTITTSNKIPVVWINRKEYTVTVATGANGKNTTVGERSNSATATSSTANKTITGVRYDEKLTATATPNTGYAFSGWSGDYTTATTNPISFKVQKNGAIKSSFTANTYKVVYYNGATACSTVTHTYDVAKNLTKWADVGCTVTNSDKGWSFYGWATTNNTTSRSYTDGQSVVNLTANAGTEYKLYAIYSRAVSFKSGVSATTTSGTRTQYWNPYGTTDGTHLSAVASPAVSTTNLTTYGWSAEGWRNDTTASTSEYDASTDVYPVSNESNILYGVYKRKVTFKSGVNQAITDGTSTQYLNASTNKVSSINSYTPSTATLTTHGWEPLGYRHDSTATVAEYSSGTNTSISPKYNVSETLYGVYSRTITAYSGVSKVTTNTLDQYLNSDENTVSSVMMPIPSTTTLSDYGWDGLGYRVDATATDEIYTKATEYNVAYNVDNELYAVYDRTVTFKSGVNAGTTDGTRTQYLNIVSNTVSTIKSFEPTTDSSLSGWGWLSSGYRADSTASTAVYYSGTAASITPAYNVSDELYAVYRRIIVFTSGVAGATQETKTQYFNSSGNTVSSVTMPTPSTTSLTTYDWEAIGYRRDTNAETATYANGTSHEIAWNWGNSLYGVYKRTIIAYSGVSKATSKSLTQYYNTSGSVSSVTLPAPSTTNLSKYNWSVVGYRTDTTAASSSTASTATYAPIPGTVVATFYAVYSRTLTISYNGNSHTGGTTSPTTKTIYLNTNSTTTSDQEVTLASNGFNKTGYTFSEWAEGSATGTRYGVGASYTAGVAYNATTFGKTMYAIWSANELLFNNQTISATFSTSKQTKTFTSATNGTTSYKYTITGTGASNFSATGTTFTINASTPVGTYTLTVTATDNNSGKSKAATFTVGIVKAACPSSSLTVTAYSGTYDESIHYATIKSSIAGMKIVSGSAATYGTDIVSSAVAGTSYNLKPGYTNAGTYTIYYKTSHSNYNDCTGSTKVTIPKRDPAGSVKITGTNTFSNTLTASVTNTNTATLAYQWWYATTSSATSGTNISGATAASYTIGAGLVGKYIGVTVTATKTNFNTAKWTDITDATNNTTATVAKAACPSSAFTVTAYSGTYDGSAHYATIKSSIGAMTIVSGTSTSYGNSIVTSSTANSSYNLKPGATNVSTTTVYWKSSHADYADCTGSTTVKITKQTGTCAATITGTNKYNQSLTATISTNSNGTKSYAWYKKSTSGTASGTSLSNTASTYKVGAGMVGQYIYVIATIAESTNYTSATCADVINGPIEKADCPSGSITVTAYSGTYDESAHYATIKSSIGAMTIVSGTSTSYGNSIVTSSTANASYNLKPGATNASTTTVYWKTSHVDYADCTGSTKVTIPKKNLSGSVKITGTNTFGQTLTASVTNTNTATLAYQWWYATTSSATSGTNISGATSVSYTIGAGLVGKYIGVTVTATKTNFNTAKWTDITDATNNKTATVAKAACPSSAFTVTAYTGTYNKSAHYATIKSSIAGMNITSGSTTGYAKSVSTSTVALQSYNLLPGATDASTTTVYWKATHADYADCTGSTTVKIAKATGTCAATITGTNKYNQSLTATISTNSNGTKSYAWYKKSTSGTASGTSLSNTASTYKVVSGMVGQYIYVIATIAEATNYTSATCADVINGSIDKADCPSGSITLTPYSGTYDGSTHYATIKSSIGAMTIVSGTSTSYGNSIVTSSTANASYNLKPGQSIAGTYTVYYKTTHADYADCTGSTKVTIPKYSPTLSLNPTSGTENVLSFGSFKAITTTLSSCTGTLVATSGNSAYVRVGSSTGTSATANITAVSATNSIGYYGNSYTAGTKITVTFTPKSTANCSVVSKSYTASIARFNPTVSLTAKTATYTGSAISANAATATYNGSGIGLSYTYTYYTDSSCSTTTTTANGAASAGAAPKYVGNYYVRAVSTQTGTFSSATSSCVAHNIVKRTSTCSVKITGTNAINQTLTATITTNSDATKSYAWYYNSSNSTSGGTTLNTTTQTYKIGSGLAGKYIYVSAGVAGDSNNTAASCSDITDATNNTTATVAKASSATLANNISVTAYSGTADASAHYATIKSTLAGVTIVSGTTTSYGTTVVSSAASGTSYNLSPSRTTIGTTTVYYKVSHPDYNDYTGSTTVTIKPLPVVLYNVRTKCATVSCTIGKACTISTTASACTSSSYSTYAWSFNGWNSSTSTTTPSISNGGTTTTSSSMNLYAVYKRDVKFVSGVAKAQTATVTQTMNTYSTTTSSITMPTPKTITNWTTQGWRDDQNHINYEYSAGTSTAAAYNSTQTYYATYKKSATLYYNTDSSVQPSRNTDSVTVHYTSAASTATSYVANTITMPTGTKTCSNVYAWTTPGRGTTGTYNVATSYSGFPVTQVSASAGSITMTPKSSILTYNVVLNGNGCLATSTATKSCGTNLTLPSKSATKTGYTFGGWATSTANAASGSVAYANQGSYTTNSGTTLYAICKPITYYMSYTCPGFTCSSGVSGSLFPTSAKYDQYFNVTTPQKSGSGVTVTFKIPTSLAGITYSSTAVTTTPSSFSGWKASGLNTTTAYYGTSSSSINTNWSNGNTMITANYFKNLRSSTGTVSFIAQASYNMIKFPTLTTTVAGASCVWSTNSTDINGLQDSCIGVEGGTQTYPSQLTYYGCCTTGIISGIW